MPQHKLESVVEMAAKAKALRRDILLQVYKAQSGHPGGSLSWIDIGVALYYHEMTLFPEDPANPARDRFVLSAEVNREHLAKLHGQRRQQRRIAFDL